MVTDSQEKFDAFLSAAVDAVIVIGEGGAIEEFNVAAQRMFGYSRDDVLGRNVNMLMPADIAAEHDQYLSNYCETGVAKIIGIGREIVCRRADGGEFPARLSVGEARGGAGRYFVGLIHDLTEQKRTQGTLQAYLDLADVILLALDGDGHVAMINRKGCEVLGRSEAQVIGRQWMDFIPSADLPGVRDVFESLIGGVSDRSLHFFENHVLREDGETRLIAWHNRIARDTNGDVIGTFSSGQDITDTRAAGDALRRSESALMVAQQVANIGNFDLRLPGNGDDFLSSQMVKILGLPAAIGASRGGDYFRSLVHPDDQAQFRLGVERARAAGGQVDMEYRIVRPSGEVRILHLMARVRERDDGGQTVLRLVGAVHDVTERRRAEEDARQARERLTHVSRLSTMGEMASGLAHELNQPLTAISAFAQACKRMASSGKPMPEEELVGILDQINNQALRAGAVIERLRDMVKKRAARRELTDCNALVEDLITLAEPDARAANLALQVELEDNLRPVLVDTVQIHQVLLNLVRNAIDASSDVSEEERRIYIETRRAGPDDVEIAVTDHGCGLQEDGAARLFTPFYTTKESGTGLGLPISQSIVRAHGGVMRYDANEPHGAVFSFTLPCAQAD